MSLRTVHVSRLLVPLIAALLVSAAVPSIDASCNLAAPGNCSFRNASCQWSARHWSLSNRYTYLSYRETSGSLTSRYLCVGSAVSHCLRFQYYLKNNRYSLKVDIKFLHQRNNSQIQLWETLGGAKWKTAEIAVKANSNFRLVIEGTRKRRESNLHIRIKNLTYDKNNCSHEAVPIITIVSSSRTHGLTTSTSTPTTVASSRNTTLTSVSSFFSGNITTTVTPGRFSTSVSTSKTRSSRKSDTTTVNNQATDSSSSSPFSTHSVTNNSSADGLRGDADSSTDVGVIVGVVLAAILIGCLIVTLIVFLRWKQLMYWKLNSDDKQTAVQVCFKGEACGASSNVGATRNDNYTQLDIADASRPHCYSSLTEVRASQISMENYSAVRDVSGDPSTLTESTATLYELAQPVLPSAPNGLVNSGFQSSLDSLYENNGGQSIFQHREDDGHSNHNVVCFNNRDGKEHTEPVYSKQAPYEHIHSACKSDTGGKGRLGKLDNDPQTLSSLI